LYLNVAFSVARGCGPNGGYSTALDGALFAVVAFSASLTTCIVRKMLDGLMLIESMPSCAR
jgi:hypothetical protein